MRHSHHIQCRLRDDWPAETEAVATYYWLKQSDPGWIDRVIVREGLLALREKLDTGYAPILDQGELRFTREMRDILALIMEHVKMLSTIDLSAARQNPEWDEKRYQDMTSQLNKSVVNLFGASKTYGDDDD